jgi:hypothetical protein
VADGGNDVPIAEVDAARVDRDRVRILDEDLAVDDRVDGRPVAGDYVDAEVERPRAAGDSRVVEGAANRMRPIERLDRPAVRQKSPS